MDKTKFFTEQVPGGSRRGEASDEDMRRGITDFGAEEISDDSTFFMPEEAVGLSAEAKAGSTSPYVACGTASPQPRSGAGRRRSCLHLLRSADRPLPHQALVLEHGDLGDRDTGVRLGLGGHGGRHVRREVEAREEEPR
jgi:hypothetical protein